MKEASLWNPLVSYCSSSSLYLLLLVSAAPARQKGRHPAIRRIPLPSDWPFPSLPPFYSAKERRPETDGALCVSPAGRACAKAPLSLPAGAGPFRRAFPPRRGGKARAQSRVLVRKSGMGCAQTSDFLLYACSALTLGRTGLWRHQEHEIELGCAQKGAPRCPRRAFSDTVYLHVNPPRPIASAAVCLAAAAAAKPPSGCGETHAYRKK